VNCVNIESPILANVGRGGLPNRSWADLERRIMPAAEVCTARSHPAAMRLEKQLRSAAAAPGGATNLFNVSFSKN
jgi:hypothetical protein